MASSTAAPAQYPAQIVFMSTDEQADALTREAERRRVSKATVAREWYDAGREAAEVAAEWGVSVDEVLNAARVRLDDLYGLEKATTRAVEQ